MTDEICRTWQLHGLSSTQQWRTAEAIRSPQSIATTRSVSKLGELDALVVIRHYCATIPHLQSTGTLGRLLHKLTRAPACKALSPFHFTLLEIILIRFLATRDLITLPNINAKASDVYNRVIPEPNGDCKLMAYPGTEEYDTYGVSITGLPSAIACGLSADSADGDGVSLPIGAGTTSNTTTPDNTTSTDGQGGAYVPAPPAAPFADLSPNDYACISSTTSHASLCLPPGTYNKQTGLGLKIKDIDTLTLPVGGFQFQAYWEDAPIPRSPRPQGHTINNYTENQSPPANSKDFYGFAADMKAIDTNRDGQAKFTISGPSTGPDPMCCLYSATALGGDAWCGGIGGGPILDQWQNQAQSAKCFNGGNMWIYADSYDDKGGAKIDGETDDLTNVPYGDTENFSKQVKAVWILKG